LDRKRHWVRAAVERIEENRKFVEPDPLWRLPPAIKLTAIGKAWRVEGVESEMSWAAVHELGPDGLRVQGNIEGRESCEAALQRWLMRQAHKHLVPWLREVSRQIHIPFGRILVKRQRTRWASCSKARTISVNARLLFLESDLVRYVFVHELCHAVYLNHSREFWALLKHHDPDYTEKDKRLRSAWRHVPTWINRYGTWPSERAHERP
jgi:predicted metal-dependent hydrolase